jgi:hypothetical protein
MADSRATRPVPAYGLELRPDDIKVGDQVLGYANPRHVRTVTRIERATRRRPFKFHFAGGEPPLECESWRSLQVYPRGVPHLPWPEEHYESGSWA